MSDILLVCQNCHNTFVYSDLEQQQNLKNSSPAPIYCPICRAIKAAESKRPAKPKA